MMGHFLLQLTRSPLLPTSATNLQRFNKGTVVISNQKFSLNAMIAATLLASTGMAHSGLIGDTVGTTYLEGVNNYGTVNAVVGVGDEGNFFTNQFFDYGDFSFDIRSIANYCGITCNGQTVQLVLSSLDFGNPLLGVNFSTNLSGVSMGFTANSVTFSWTDQALFIGTYLHADFSTGQSVPEPTSIALVGLAIVGLGLATRKRKVAN